MPNRLPYWSLLAWMGALSFAAADEPAGAGIQLKNPVTIRAHIGRPADVEFSPDGQLLAAGGYFSARGGAEVIQGGLGIWDLRTLKRTEASFRDLPEGFRPRVRAYPYLNFRSVAFSPDGQILAAGVGAYKPENGRTFNGLVALFDARTGKQKAVFSGHSDQVTWVQFQPDGRRLASASDDKTIRLWDLGSSQEVLTLKGHDKGVKQLVFSGDGKSLASAGGGDKSVRVWDAKRGTALAAFNHDGPVWAVQFSPDAKSIAAAVHVHGAGTDGQILVWDRSTRELKAKLQGHRGEIRDIAFNPDGELLVSVGGTPLVRRFRANSGGPGELKLWDAASGKKLASIETKDQFTSVAFSPNGNRLAAANLDGTIRLWDLVRTNSSEKPSP